MRNLFARRGGGEGSGPDFSHVDSREKAERLVSRGELALLHLVPPEFGGTDDPRNLVYVPPFAVELKQRTDANVIAPLVREGRVCSYAATPRYDGASFVPASIEIRASDPGDLTTSLRIWGPGSGTTERCRGARLRALGITAARPLLHASTRFKPHEAGNPVAIDVRIPRMS